MKPGRKVGGAKYDYHLPRYKVGFAAECTAEQVVLTSLGWRKAGGLGRPPGRRAAA